MTVGSFFESKRQQSPCRLEMAMGRLRSHPARLMLWGKTGRNRRGGFQRRWDARSSSGELDGWNHIHFAPAVVPSGSEKPAKPHPAAVKRLPPSPVGPHGFNCLDSVCY